MKELLRNLSDPRSPHDDRNVEYTVNRMVELYTETGDEAILIAVDSTEIDAGFANYICGFYHDIKSQPGFKRRYGYLRLVIERIILETGDLAEWIGYAEDPARAV